MWWWLTWLCAMMVSVRLGTSPFIPQRGNRNVVVADVALRDDGECAAGHMPLYPPSKGE